MTSASDTTAIRVGRLVLLSSFGWRRHQLQLKELIPHWFKSLRMGCSEQHIALSAVIVV